MKKHFAIIIFLLLAATSASGQSRVFPNMPYMVLNTRPGYITINEFGTGIGISSKSFPYSKYFYGITSIHGYQLNGSMVIAGGTGLLLYNDGPVIPLFLDLRYRLLVDNLTIYVYGDGGFLLNPKELNAKTMMFVNAGPGARFTLNPTLALNFSPGLQIQMGPDSRASFINFRMGATFKPR
ncbi:MAG: hypothetical protein FJY11_05465 [Bacteroidetes bacterium]|nr:hypothetical protein [Bacteroidota bacterium]